MVVAVQSQVLPCRSLIISRTFRFQNFGLEYERYLKEIVSALETDEAFRKKLEESNISDIKVMWWGIEAACLAANEWCIHVMCR